MSEQIPNLYTVSPLLLLHAGLLPLPLMVSKDLLLPTNLPTTILPPASPPPSIQSRNTRPITKTSISNSNPSLANNTYCNSPTNWSKLMTSAVNCSPLSLGTLLSYIQLIASLATFTALLTSSICLMYFRMSSFKNPVLRVTFLSRALILLDSLCQMICTNTWVTVLVMLTVLPDLYFSPFPSPVYFMPAW